MVKQEENKFIIERRNAGRRWQDVADDFNAKFYKRITVDSCKARYFRSQKSFPVLPKKKFAPLNIKGDCAVTCDWHIPLQDDEFCNLLLEKSKGIDQLVVIGDFFNFDSLSTFDNKQEDADFQTEIETARYILGVLGNHFKKLYFIWGNHENRILRALNYQAYLKDIFDLVGVYDKTQVSELDHLILNDTWFMAHQKNYSAVPLSVARGLSAKYPKYNVVCSHQHYWALGATIDGNRLMVDMGCMCDSEKVKYYQRTTKFPAWSNSFGIIKDNRLTMYDKEWLQ